MLLLFDLFVNNLTYRVGVQVSAPEQHIEWSQYAYCQYVTTTEYLCNSIMIFESLQRLGSKASRILLYPKEWAQDSNTEEGRLLLKARDELGVVLKAIEVQHFDGEKTWADSFTKLLAFNQTEYKRVLSLDSDATVLQSMDELFLVPSAPVAMPRAYWIEDKPTLSSQLVLVEPSTFEMNRVLEAFQHRSPSDYDMEIVNDLYGKDCIIIPHRRYDLLTGEFRNRDHHLYLGSKEEIWDPEVAYNEAKFLHFSDWPFPKPWIKASREQVEEVVPKCHRMTNGTEDCRDREKWLFVYQEFRERRERVCGIDFV
ncbi:hypothetical protein AC578_3073 [Pseudocercospora eumusae]|uniref:Nucleotide-diphospho-sugar transferase n=1 Tax=Pseudocercospora eumusae TaxID=321146 RepID=A0A139H3U3_9PEZI|nr:hypothetical protein AC578_3073 [Pseudocercospora eumusae]